MLRPMRASIITPTRGRPALLRAAYRWFEAQDAGELEWLILDDSSAPDSFLSQVTRPDVRYMHQARPLPLGAKRNVLVDAARADVIVQFDDDNVYAPQYVRRMIEQLGDADLFTMSAWFCYAVASRSMYYWDVEVADRCHFLLQSGADPQLLLEPSASQDHESLLFGYGFSYVFRKAAWRNAAFPEDVNFAEDYAMAKALRERGFRIVAEPDREGLAIAVLHAQNQSRFFPQYVLPPFVWQRLFGSDVADYLAALPLDSTSSYDGALRRKILDWSGAGAHRYAAAVTWLGQRLIRR
jgi:glycosyltransferase involved in cell wall biosynthesis